MDPELQRCLDLIKKIESEVKPAAGPIVLDAEYLALIEHVEQLPMNRPGSDHSGREANYRHWREHYARVRQSFPPWKRSID
jgi:hypothetical protein